jgi:hypothetical protein
VFKTILIYTCLFEKELDLEFKSDYTYLFEKESNLESRSVRI